MHLSDAGYRFASSTVIPTGEPTSLSDRSSGPHILLACLLPSLLFSFASLPIYIPACLLPRARDFCTRVHRFAQSFDQNLIDAANEAHYLLRQIEPEAEELYGSVEKAQQA